ncbi:MAG: excinuclease ABC subunit UvrA [Deltaproteobacteria bacterium]|nr:excinuclease ABC subunit UvrA [Deltaproteobacteria bacterium]
MPKSQPSPRPSPRSYPIVVRGACTHNLKSIDLDLPRGQLIGVGGVSGSGKSSLAFHTLFREGQRRFLQSLSTHARQFLARFPKPDVEVLTGLSPALAIDQASLARSPRSTVGTASGCLDLLRLLFARLGSRPCPQCGVSIPDNKRAQERCKSCDAPLPELRRSLFSFNSPLGCCEACEGLGVVDRVDPDLLVADSTRSLRQGALIPTTKSGYIVYSQVTTEVMEQICQAHGFSVHTPWCELDDEARQVVFFGSRRLKVPFGKHALESRMRWSGITARPREEGYYRGIIPVIEEILGRDRNPNALRFARSRPCPSCAGRRLNPTALATFVAGQSIADLCALETHDLRRCLLELDLGARLAPVLSPLQEALNERLSLMVELGLSHLTLDRGAQSLSGGEGRRLRLLTQLLGGLSGVLYVLDEPSAGLHPREVARLLKTLTRLRDGDNTVVVVEHDVATLQAVDYLVEIGPHAGHAGGEVIAAGPLASLLTTPPDPRSQVLPRLLRPLAIMPNTAREDIGEIWIRGACANNLRWIDVMLKRGALNAISGVSGAGKTSLAHEVLGATLKRRLRGRGDALEGCSALEGATPLERLVEVDQSPIGRTPRSNAATYTKLFDGVRAIFAAEVAAKECGFSASHFSFNVKGGRCESCQGAGVISVGMHFLADAQVTCDACSGQRFTPEVLAIRHEGLNIAEVLELQVDRALVLFAKKPKLARMLECLVKVGLGYLRLGQPAPSLSGGEAQRVKLAAELGLPKRGETLYLLDEPTTGLHPVDVERLLSVLEGLADQGHTVVVVEHDRDVLARMDHLVDLGPGSGAQGGEIVAMGAPQQVLEPVLEEGLFTHPSLGATAGAKECPQRAIELRGVTTHNLQSLDVSFPLHAVSAVTGVSGSGKSSLVFDTLASEAQRRFTENLSVQARRFMVQLPRPTLATATGLRPTIAIAQAQPARNPRSTVATMTEIYDTLRLLFSRFGQAPPQDSQRPLNARLFSFNHEAGACPQCTGLGRLRKVAPERLVSRPHLSLLEGAMDGHPRARFYGEPDGQYVATLGAVGQARDIDFSVPWLALSEHARDLAMFGAGEQSFSVSWVFKRGKRQGEHHFEGPWLGFARLLDVEYQRTHADKRGARLEALMGSEVCETCDGRRLAPAVQAIHLAGRSIGDICALTIAEALTFFTALDSGLERLSERSLQLSADARQEIVHRLGALVQVGLDYLTLDRSTPTLSSGESRRVRLATQLGSPLVDVLYVLDEPTVGLHSEDSRTLVKALRDLCDHGNTVVVVEHDPQLLRHADHVVELGPGAGAAGGRVIATGSPEEIAKNPQSIIGPYLHQPANPIISQAKEPDHWLRIEGACVHNLQRIEVAIPCGALVAISGVSGSGKSTLTFEVLGASVEARAPVGCQGVHGLEHFAALCSVDARPIGQTPASSPATYCGVWDHLRVRLAATEQARTRKFSKARFSTANKAGQCPTCKGLGATRHALDFLADVWTPCSVCRGQRFEPKTLEVRLRGKNAADLLALRIKEALLLFEDCPEVARPLGALAKVGLGHLELGQWANTLSGGEAQRLKLARELARVAPQTGTLYLVDEPSRGLHPHDVEHLLGVFRELVERGDTLVLVEHDLTLIAAADWVVDLGPGGGPTGGRVVMAGPPSALAACSSSATGRALAGWQSNDLAPTPKHHWRN